MHAEGDAGPDVTTFDTYRQALLTQTEWLTSFKVRPAAITHQPPSRVD
jgi:hypothetical protein